MANCFVRVTSQQREQNPNLPALAAKNNGAEFISRNPYPPDGTTAAGASGITAFGDARSFSRHLSIKPRGAMTQCDKFLHYCASRHCPVRQRSLTYDSITEGGKDRGPAQAVSVARARLSLAENRSQPRASKAQHVAEIVASIGQQG
jgi:hypothetical protein